MRQVLIQTEYRGTYAGEIPDDADLTQRSMPLYNARMAIYWGTTKGIMELAATGPTSASKISAMANIPMLHGIVAIHTITQEAWEKWMRY
jgi:hypothetical protein